jgi:hypothetical protein
MAHDSFGPEAALQASQSGAKTRLCQKIFLPTIAASPYHQSSTPGREYGNSVDKLSAPAMSASESERTSQIQWRTIRKFFHYYFFF